MINADAFALMKDGVKILNFARDVLVNDEDMKAALDSGKVAKYMTDFPNPAIAGYKNVEHSHILELQQQSQRTIVQLWLVRRSRHTSTMETSRTL